MRTKTLTLLIALIFIFSADIVSAQPPVKPEPIPLRFTEVKRIKGEYMMIDVDALNNIYAITRDFQLKKYNPNGDSLSVWNDVKAYGNPTMLDVSNPLRILLYYKPFATVVILDRFLALRYATNLRKKGIFKMEALANSYDNNIWLFDEQDLRIKKIDDEGNVLFETADWRILFETAPSPSRIIDHENSIYLFDEETGLYVFDYYGSLKKRMEIPGWKITGKNKSFLYGFSKNILHTAELPSLNLKDYYLPENITGGNNIRVMNNMVYLLKEDGIRIFRIENYK